MERNTSSFNARQELQKLQFSKLQFVLGEIEGNNTFYTKKFSEGDISLSRVQSIDDLRGLPFTSKHELMSAQTETNFAGNLTYPLSQYTRFHQTSGTTGEPLRVLDTEESWEWWGKCWKQVYEGAGVGKEDRIFSAFSFGPFIGFWAAVEGARQLGALFLPGGGRSSIDRLKMMRETGATVLLCTPSYALHLLEVAKENDFDISSLKIHTSIHAGEPGANIPSIKSKIETGWSSKCYDHAGASEVGAYGFESCDRPNGITVNESEFIVEVLNTETGESVNSGEEGELIITNLGRAGFPIIRYRTGDVVKVTWPEPDSSEYCYFEGGIIGRADDMVTVRGVNIYPSALDNLLRSIENIDEYRITVETQDQMSELNIEIEVNPSADETDIQSALVEAVRDKLGLRPGVKVVAHDSLPRFELKGKRFHIKQ